MQEGEQKGESKRVKEQEQKSENKSEIEQLHGGLPCEESGYSLELKNMEKGILITWFILL